MRRLIGLSLSLCVGDICRGKVELSQVDKIIAGTRANPEDLDLVIATYRSSTWAEFPDQAEQIARQLFQDGKVDQPRLRGEKHPGIANGYWLVDGVPTSLI